VNFNPTFDALQGDTPMAAEYFMNRKIAAPKLKRATFYFRLFLVISLLFIIATWADHWIRGELGVGEKMIEMAKGQMGYYALAIGGLLYVVLLSLPFVPGVELGILLMCAFGKEGIVFVYIATVVGLMLAFLMGRMLPKKRVESLLDKMGLPRPNGDASDEVISFLDGFLRKKRRLRTLFLNYRYPVIGVLFNMPGVYLLGGGGGISLACGMSRNISFNLFLLTVVLAVSPVPLLAYCGVIQLEALF
jgi:hypothetical protein